GKLTPITWREALETLLNKLKVVAKVNLIIGTDVTNEEAQLLMDNFKTLTSANVSSYYLNAVQGVNKSSDDKDIDTLLRRQDKTANTKGLEKLGLTPYQNEKADITIHLRSGRASLLQGVEGFKIAFGVFTQEELAGYDLHLAGMTTLEKNGSYTNCQDITQTFK